MGSLVEIIEGSHLSSAEALATSITVIEGDSEVTQVTNLVTETVTLENTETVILEVLAGAKGEDGTIGDDGPAGPPNTLAIGTVTLLDVGEPPTATITGTSPNQTLNLGIPEGRSSFRGPWVTDEIAIQYGFTTGLPEGFTTAIGGSGQTPVGSSVASASANGSPAGWVSAMKLNNVHLSVGSFSEISIDLATLGISGITRATAWFGMPDLFSSAEDYVVAALRVNGAVVTSTVNPRTWVKIQATCDSNDVLAIRAYDNYGATFTDVNTNVHVTGLEIYAAPDPYLINDFVTHLGHMWRSLVDNNSATPGSDATKWERVMAGAPGGVIPPFSLGGVAAVQAFSMRLYAPVDCTILSVRASVGTAPTGAGLIVDINKNGTTIFTTQSNRPTIAPGTNTDNSVPDVTTLLAGDYLTIDIDQVGSTVAGSDLSVQVVAS